MGSRTMGAVITWQGLRPNPTYVARIRSVSAQWSIHQDDLGWSVWRDNLQARSSPPLLWAQNNIDEPIQWSYVAISTRQWSNMFRGQHIYGPTMFVATILGRFLGSGAVLLGEYDDESFWRLEIAWWRVRVTVGKEGWFTMFFLNSLCLIRGF